jgi:ketosteroid isomerase-like protein
MNAAERLWRGLAARDWAAVRSQFAPNAVVEWPHDGSRLDADAYVASARERAAGGLDVAVVRVVSEGRGVVVEGRAGDARCAGIYDLHDGLVAGAVEYWIPAHAAPAREVG